MFSKSIERLPFLILAAIFATIPQTFLKAADQVPSDSRQHILIDADWLFHRGDIENQQQATAVNYDDGQWERIHLPHDYVLDGSYSPTLDRSHGYLPVEVGWYRKHYFIPGSCKGKTITLDFDGVFRDAQVWLNGQLLGRHLGGYTPFSFDISKIAKLNDENVITVRVDPRKFEGWWYEGGGIYRHVYLTVYSPVHVAQYGTYIISTVPNGDQGADEQANLTIQTTLQNDSASPANAEISSEIISPSGGVLQTLKATQSLAPHDHPTATQQTTIIHPKLWSVESPSLYTLHTEISQNGKVVDSTVTTFGIRTIRFDPDQGFFLNGHHVEIHGAACHQDFAGVGIAVPDSLQYWRVAQLKQLGTNGWRTAHNAPNEAVLDACDRAGMLVMDENRHLGDTYLAKTMHGTGTYDLSDLATTILRDRNHPSVIMWSMCNEEDLQGTPEAARIFTAMKNVVEKYDRIRPVTSAMNGREGSKIFMGHGIADVEDIIGVNYNYEALDAIHKRHPDKPMFGSEDCNEKTTRGQYANDRTAGMSSAFNLSENTWLALETRPFIAGGYIWTGFDYKGEPNPYGWPDVSNNTGMLDSCGFRKDKAYYFQSCWTSDPMVHLLPMSWNLAGKEGEKIRVMVFSNVPQVELFLNGHSLGLRDIPRHTHAEWHVPYEPGQLIAKAYGQGGVVATDTVETTGAPTRIELSVPRHTLTADGEDALVAAVSVVDDQGRIVPTSSDPVTFQLSGGGQILGVGNGNPADHDTDKSNQRTAFHGRCIAVIGAPEQPATLQLTATAPGLAPASVNIDAR